MLPTSHKNQRLILMATLLLPLAITSIDAVSGTGGAQFQDALSFFDGLIKGVGGKLIGIIALLGGGILTAATHKAAFLGSGILVAVVLFLGPSLISAFFTAVI